MNRWTKFKHDMLHSIRSDSINKRRTFENQLRKPVQMPAKLPFKESNNDGSSPVEESHLKDTDVLSTNYLASAQYIFKAAKKKR